MFWLDGQFQLSDSLIKRGTFKFKLLEKLGTFQLKNK